ncbi:MAG: LPS assembly protein LptD [Xanthomonadales bacterium]|nr:LPS assembly protein LptD [Xanthomonadales bacterium]
MLTRVLLGVGLTLTPLAAALAQSLCPATYWECLPGEDGQPHCEPVADQPREAQPVLLSADRIEGSNNENYVLRGDARAERADQQLRADELSYNVPGEILRATGSVRYQDRQVALQASAAEARLAADETDLDQTRFQLAASPANGDAEQARRRGQLTELEQVVFSTCDPQQRSWSIEASELTLDHEKGEGRARDFKLRLGRVPVFYLPYAVFPITEDRKSGFLAPAIGYNDVEGLDLSLPYYFNLAPNYDATLTPRLISDRGLLLGGEFRYLDQRQQGEYYAAFMPSDDLADRDRWRYRLKHFLNLSHGWYFHADAQRVSDARYFEDFGDSLSNTAQSVLGSQIGITGRGQQWQAGLLVEDFQLIDPTQPNQVDPYRRLPRLYYDGRFTQTSGWRYGVAADLSWFDRAEGTTGGRFDLWPYLGWRAERPWGFVEPRLGYRFTQYELDGGLGSRSRSLPVASLDAGLVFERPLQLGGRSMRQTLEPRAFYLYVPDRNQDDLPIFDSAPLDFSYSQLFRYNRFTGADRMSDANQLAIGVSSRFIDDATGSEKASISIGQVRYFDPPEVELPGVLPVDRSGSVIVSEISYSPTDRWRLALAQQWDPSLEETRLNSLRANYRFGVDGVASARYLYRPGQVEQIDIGAVVPISDRWKLIGRYNYSLRDKRNFETLAGFEYRSCCYAVRLVGRRYLRSAGFDHQTGIYLELELTGLGRLGRKTGSLLERAILGYREPND